LRHEGTECQSKCSMRIGRSRKRRPVA
jgi:hypothetical protein